MIKYNTTSTLGGGVLLLTDWRRTAVGYRLGSHCMMQPGHPCHGLHAPQSMEPLRLGEDGGRGPGLRAGRGCTGTQMALPKRSRDSL